MITRASLADRRAVMRGAAGLSLFGLFGGARAFAAPMPDMGSGKIAAPTPAELAKFPRLAAGKEGEAFAVALPNGERHIFRVSGGDTGPATVESIGPNGVRKTSTIAENDTPVAMLRGGGTATTGTQKSSSGSFWGCYATCMIGKIGQGAWNNLKTNWLSCWNQAQSKKKWWQKVLKFTQCIFTLPYGSYAIACFGVCG